MEKRGNCRLRLGLNIRRYRRYIQRITRAELAHKVGCTAQAISEFERGKREVSVTMLLQLSAALACTPADLMQGIEK